MAKVVRRHWQSEASAGLPRRDRQSCQYEAYVPDPLMGRAIALEGAVAADVANAEAAITRLNREARTLVDTEALARLLLRAEAVASSKIEGLEIGPRRLLEAEAMFYAVRSVRSDEELTLEQLLEIHRRLLAGSRLEESGGKIRSAQNWIGGSSYKPCSAVFVPPPPELVHDLLLDLCRFCNDDSLPAVVQAALAHAQFETIHPFIDGNGRTGRALIHLTLRRRGLAPRVLPPVSLVLATWATDYVAALEGTRYRGQSASSAAHEGLNRWVGLFATACRRAVDDADEFDARTRGLEAAWRERLGAVRANSATDLRQHLGFAQPGDRLVRSSQTARDEVGGASDSEDWGAGQRVQQQVGGRVGAHRAETLPPGCLESSHTRIELSCIVDRSPTGGGKQPDPAVQPLMSRR